MLNIPNTGDWVIVYHRHPPGDINPHHRALCMDHLEFADDGSVRPVKMTNAFDLP